MFKNILSVEKVENHIIFNLFGFKLSIRNKKDRQEIIASKIIQDSLDLGQLKHAKKIILFLTPYEQKLNGGVMSLFSLCQTTREIVKDAYCCVATYPNGYTYVINDKFYNTEKVLRFEQIVNKAINVQKLIIHIPEYYSSKFYNDLKRSDISFLKSVPNLQLNILNQNIDVMPEPDKLKDLYKLTSNITQTVAHNRYATQEICEKYQIPTHLFSVNIDLSKYKTYSFEEKEKIIALSPDENEYREEIVTKLKSELSDWEILTIKNLSFSQYMDLIGRAYFTITFGEGMDGYFNQPIYVGGIGVAVYNDDFFPNESWKELKNVYTTYEEMATNICKDLKEVSSNKDLYIETINKQLNKLNEIYVENKYRSNIERFYAKEYDFEPKAEVQERETINEFVEV